MLTATYLTGESRPIAGPSIENVPKALARQASSVPEPPCANGCQHIPRSRREKKKRNFASVTNYRL